MSAIRNTYKKMRRNTCSPLSQTS